MNFLVIPDKFKDSLTAKEVIDAITKGLIKADKTATIKSVIASDGGDGFLDAVANNVSCERITMKTVNPLNHDLNATYLFNKVTKTAYIELAKASGLELLKVAERSALSTTTFGSGLQIADAIDKGAKTIYVGLGGSATNDAGMGIAMALGYVFLDKNGDALSPIGSNLEKVDKILYPENKKLIDAISIFAVNDVDNPLFGTHGAAHVYAKQKGASEQEIIRLDKGLVHFNSIAEKQLNVKNALVPGAGAAGGTAYGLKTFLNAEFISGIEFLLELAKVAEFLQQNKIDYIITGEGKIDAQTSNGKLVKGVTTIAQKFHIPIVGICGKLDLNEEQIQKMGLENAFQIYDPEKGVAYSMENASRLVEDVLFQFFSKKQCL